MSRERLGTSTARKVPRSQVFNLSTNTDIIGEDEYQIVYQEKSNYWDQLRALVLTQGWTTQDHATLSLLQEMPNSHTFFIVRGIDDTVLGGANIVETDAFMYSNFYVVRDEYRGAGLAIQLMRMLTYSLLESFRRKGFVARAAKPMWKVYINPPMNAKFLYDMYCVTFHGVNDLEDFFPCTSSTTDVIKPMKEVMMSPKLLQSVIEYDTFVTGQDRSQFIKAYYSIDFVEGVVLFDVQGNVKGMAGVVPTGNTEGLFKLNPIFASSVEDVGILVRAIASRVNHRKPQFMAHVRNKSAGDWVLHKCRETKRNLKTVGATISITGWPIYKDVSRTEMIFAPTNSPAHFDG